MFLRILLLAVTLLISCRTTDSEIKSNGLEKFPTNTIKETRDFYITISAKSIGTFSEIDKLKDRPDSISDQQIEKLDEIFEVSGQKNAILKNILQEGLVSPTNNTEAKRSEVQTSVDNIDRFNRRLRRAIAGLKSKNFRNFEDDWIDARDDLQTVVANFGWVEGSSPRPNPGLPNCDNELVGLENYKFKVRLVGRSRGAQLQKNCAEFATEFKNLISLEPKAADFLNVNIGGVPGAQPKPKLIIITDRGPASYSNQSGELQIPYTFKTKDLANLDLLKPYWSLFSDNFNANDPLDPAYFFPISFEQTRKFGGPPTIFDIDPQGKGLRLINAGQYKTNSICREVAGLQLQDNVEVQARFGGISAKSYFIHVGFALGALQNRDTYHQTTAKFVYRSENNTCRIWVNERNENTTNFVNYKTPEKNCKQSNTVSFASGIGNRIFSAKSDGNIDSLTTIGWKPIHAVCVEFISDDAPNSNANFLLRGLTVYKNNN